jgi:hypothetical protein
MGSIAPFLGQWQLAAESQEDMLAWLQALEPAVNQSASDERAGHMEVRLM